MTTSYRCSLASPTLGSRCWDFSRSREGSWLWHSATNMPHQREPAVRSRMSSLRTRWAPEEGTALLTAVLIGTGWEASQQLKGVCGGRWMVQALGAGVVQGGGGGEDVAQCQCLYCYWNSACVCINALPPNKCKTDPHLEIRLKCKQFLSGFVQPKLPSVTRRNDSTPTSG
jgi:hypothetical protein